MAIFVRRPAGIRSLVIAREMDQTLRGTAYWLDDGTVVWNCFICSYLHAILILVSCSDAHLSSSSSIDVGGVGVGKSESADAGPLLPGVHMHSERKASGRASTMQTRCPLARPWDA